VRLGDSREIHVIRATAYGRQDMLIKAAGEYRAALKFTPDDGALHFGLGNTLFAERQYHDAIDELEIAVKDSPDTQLFMHCSRAPMQIWRSRSDIANVQLAEQHAQVSACH
jgi:tetratricopeptide (TPR) repeat protein